MRDNYQFEAICQWSLFRHGNASNSSTILSMTSPLGIWSSYYQVLHLGCAVAYWLLCPHPLGKNVNYFFFRSRPDGLKPTPCCFFWNSQGCTSSRIPAESERVFATPCDNLPSLLAPWGALGLPSVTFPSSAGGSMTIFSLGISMDQPVLPRNLHTTSSKDMKRISINEHIDFA